MAGEKFRFKIFNSSDPDAQYAAVSTKDPMTFYLLANGKGYLGETPLFGGGSGLTINKTNGTINEGDGSDQSHPAPSQDKVVTEADLVTYINRKIAEALSDVVTYVTDGTEITAGGDPVEDPGEDNN